MQNAQEELALDVFSEEIEKKGIKTKLDRTKKEKSDVTYKKLMNDMQSEIRDGKITITELKGKLTMNIVDKILFAVGKASVKAEGKKVLGRIDNVLKNITDKQIKIEGHTDNMKIGFKLRKKFPTNWELSTSRATTVARYLIDKSDVDPKLISVVGYAENQPIASNDTAEGRTLNRRIEIVLVPIVEEPIVEPLEKKE